MSDLLSCVVQMTYNVYVVATPKACFNEGMKNITNKVINESMLLLWQTDEAINVVHLIHKGLR